MRMCGKGKGGGGGLEVGERVLHGNCFLSHYRHSAYILNLSNRSATWW